MNLYFVPIQEAIPVGIFKQWICVVVVDFFPVFQPVPVGVGNIGVGIMRINFQLVIKTILVCIYRRGTTRILCMDTNSKNKGKNQGNGLINLHLELGSLPFHPKPRSKQQSYSAFGFKAIPRRVPADGR